MLYLPPGWQEFKCRQCCNLTYCSAQQHQPRKYLLAQNVDDIETALHDPGFERRLFALGALKLRLEWERKGRVAGSEASDRMDELLSV